MVAIRPATKEDLQTVQQLSKALFDDPTSAGDKFSDHSWPISKAGYKAFESSITNPEEALWVAVDGQAIIGFLCAGPAAPLEWRPVKRVELLSFYVMPTYRNHDIGHQLCLQFFAWARQQKAQTATVSAYADNERGIAFYKKMGFRPESLELEAEL
jgi:ribosomal protein S18 acetylase RimI-like enzyme